MSDLSTEWSAPVTPCVTYNCVFRHCHGDWKDYSMGGHGQENFRDDVSLEK